MAQTLYEMRYRREQFSVEIRRRRNEALFQENRRRSFMAVQLYQQQSLQKLTDILEKFVLQYDLPEEQLAFFEALISEIKEQIANGNIEPILTKLSNLEGVDSLFQQASLLFTQFTKKKVNLNTVCSFKELYQKWLEKVADPNTPSSSNSINKHNANQNFSFFSSCPSDAYGNEIQVINSLKLANAQIESGDQKCIAFFFDEFLEILQALRTVYNVSQNSYFTQFILTMGCIQNLLNFIYVKDKRFSSLSREILFNMTSSLEQEEAKRLIQLRCLDIVAYLLQQYENYQVRQKALSIFSNFVNSSMADVLEALLNEERVLGQLSRSLSLENLQLKIQLLNIFVYFTQMCSHDQLIRMVNSSSLSLINQLIACLQYPDQKIVLLGLKCKQIRLLIIIGILNIFIQTIQDSQEEFIRYLVINNLPSVLEELALQSLNSEVSQLSQVILYQYMIHEQNFYR